MVVSLWWVTYPDARWSHYDGWPTHMQDDGLIMMGDLPRCKVVSLWWVTYPYARWWSHYDGWPTQMQDGLIMTGDLPICNMMVSLWWVTYRGNNMENGLIVMGDLPRKTDGLIMMGDLPRWIDVTYLAQRLGWRSLDRIRLTNLALPDCRVDLKTPLDDRVDRLISLRFSY